VPPNKTRSKLMGLLTVPKQVKKDGAEVVTEFHHGVLA
jgi:hypothetical protein